MSNPTFDAGRAARIEQKALRRFNFTMASVSRYSFLWQTGLVLLAIFFFDAAFESNSPLQKLTFGMAFIVVIIQLVMLKLWFWIMNTKITLLHELKQIRSVVEPADAAPDEGAAVDMAFLGHDRRRMYLWLLTLFVVGIPLVFPAKHFAYLMAAPNACLLNTLALNPDGSSHHECTLTYVNESAVPVMKTEISNSIPETNFKAFGMTGNELSFSRRQEKWGLWTLISLDRPAFPGDWVYARTVADNPPWLTPENGLWHVYLNPNWCAYKTRHEMEIVLPEGAKVLSASPTPIVSERHNRKVLKFTATRPGSKSLHIDLTYRLAAPASGGDGH